MPSGEGGIYPAVYIERIDLETVSEKHPAGRKDQEYLVEKEKMSN